MKYNAFTIVEIVLVIAVMLFLAAISLPVYESTLSNSEVDNANKILVSTIRSAQFRSMGGVEDSQWGVKINGTTITLFKGTSYASRVVTSDINYSIPVGVSQSGPSEFVFSKIYGVSNATGTITLHKNSRTVNIVINTRGVQSY